MCFKRKTKMSVAEKGAQEREFLKECVRTAVILRDQLEDADCRDKMSKVIEDLTYANAGAGERDALLDKKIASTLGDLRILLSKRRKDEVDIRSNIDRLVTLSGERAAY